MPHEICLDSIRAFDRHIKLSYQNNKIRLCCGIESKKCTNLLVKIFNVASNTKYRPKINIRKFTYPQFSCACMKWWRGKEDTASDQTRFCILHASKAMPLEDLNIRGVTWKCKGIICPPSLPVVVDLLKWGAPPPAPPPWRSIPVWWLVKLCQHKPFIHRPTFLESETSHQAEMK